MLHICDHISMQMINNVTVRNVFSNSQTSLRSVMRKNIEAHNKASKIMRLIFESTDQRGWWNLSLLYTKKTVQFIFTGDLAASLSCHFVLFCIMWCWLISIFILHFAVDIQTPENFNLCVFHWFFIHSEEDFSV